MGNEKQKLKQKEKAGMNEVTPIPNPSATNKKTQNSDTNPKISNSENTNSSNVSNTTLDSIISCRSSENTSNATLDSIISCRSSEYSSIARENKDSDSSDSVDTYLTIEDPSRIPKEPKWGRNWLNQATHQYKNRIPATKERRDYHMKKAMVDDRKLPNYEQTSEERARLERQGCDFVLNQFGEVIKLDQISEGELKTIISKKALMQDLWIPDEERPKPKKFNLFKHVETSRPEPELTGFQRWYLNGKKFDTNHFDDRTLRQRLRLRRLLDERTFEKQVARREEKRAQPQSGFANKASDRPMTLSTPEEQYLEHMKYHRLIRDQAKQEYERKWAKTKEILIGPEPTPKCKNWYQDEDWVRWFVRAKELERKWDLESPFTETFMDWELEDRSNKARFAYCRTEFWNFNYGNCPLDMDGKIVLDHQDNIVLADNPEVNADLIRFLEKRGEKIDKDFVTNTKAKKNYWRSLLKLWRELIQVR